jgi:hypothetical protein
MGTLGLGGTMALPCPRGTPGQKGLGAKAPPGSDPVAREPREARTARTDLRHEGRGYGT